MLLLIFFTMFATGSNKRLKENTQETDNQHLENKNATYQRKVQYLLGERPLNIQLKIPQEIITSVKHLNSPSKFLKEFNLNQRLPTGYTTFKRHITFSKTSTNPKFRTLIGLKFMKRPFETFENKTSQYFQNLYNLYLSLQAATRKPLVMIAEKIPVLSLDLLKGLPPIATGIKNATPPALPAPSQESFSFKFQTPQKAQNPLKIASQPKAPPQQKSLPLDLGISWGKTSPIPPPPPPKVSNPKKAEKFPWPKRVMVNYMWGNQAEKRIPLSSNYSTFDVLFAPDYRPGHFLTFYDFRVHYIDTSTFSGNVGVGTRFIPKGERLCQMLGFNCYYDWRQGGLGYFQQLSFGVEVIGRRWDLRANAYVPIGKRPRICSCTFDEFIGDYFAIRHDIESISNSYNAEVGYLMVNGKDFSLYAATGPYFLTRAKYVSNTIGVEARIQPKFKDYLTLNLVGRYDRLFGRVFQAELSLSLPLYELRKRDLRPCGLRNWQIFQPVQRFEVMPLNQKSCWETNF